MEKPAGAFILPPGLRRAGNSGSGDTRGGVGQEEGGGGGKRWLGETVSLVYNPPSRANPGF